MSAARSASQLASGPPKKKGSKKRGPRRIRAQARLVAEVVQVKELAAEEKKKALDERRRVEEERNEIESEIEKMKDEKEKMKKEKEELEKERKKMEEDRSRVALPLTHNRLGSPPSQGAGTSVLEGGEHAFDEYDAGPRWSETTAASRCPRRTSTGLRTSAASFASIRRNTGTSRRA